MTGFRIGKIIKTLLALILCVGSFSGVIQTVRRDSSFPGTVIRISGSNRYKTAIAVAEAVQENKSFEKFDSIIVCSGLNFPDALAGSYLSAVRNAPIMPVNDSNSDLIISYVKNHITENGTIYILGGSMAVSSAVEDRLKKIDGVNVKRLQGSNRYETNLQILSECDKPNNELLICTGINYADSLSVASCGLPVLLVNEKGLTENQKEYLSRLQFSKLTVLGGEKAVSKSVQKELEQYGEVFRIRGANREETSYLIASHYYPDSDYAVVACSGNFPDGLCGGLLGYLYKAPILLVSDSRYEYAKTYVEENGIYNGKVLGGTSVVSDDTVCRIFGCSTEDIHGSGNRERYTIEYVTNEGINDTENPDSYLAGDYIVLKPATRDYYTFAGWFTDKALTNSIEYIDSKTAGNQTLYAKWHLAALNENREGKDDMIWSWWYYPQVFSDNTDSLKVFWGFTTKEGFAGIAEYDDANAKVSKTILKKSPTVDDHNGLAIKMMKDGHIMCAYSVGHNKGKEVHIRISDSVRDISNFSTDIVLESAGQTCYSQILETEECYCLCYRVNNTLWAYRSSKDGFSWSDEVILVKASKQYYCRFVSISDSNLIRVLMYSNPSQDCNDIRMGFLDPVTGNMLNADGVTSLGNNNISYDSFDIVLSPEEDKKQRLFDVAVTGKDQVRFLYASFSPKGNCDSIFRLYDSGSITDICAGGKDLFTNKYQLGASFIGNDRIVTARNQDDKDIIEIYKIKPEEVSLVKSVYQQENGTDNIRNARPIADVNGKAVLWHNGSYASNSYTDFDTSAYLYFLEEDVTLKDDSFPGITKAVRARDYSVVKPEILDKVTEYVDKVYQDNIKDDYTKGQFTWYYDNSKNSWIYTTGHMIQGFLECDLDKYCEEIIKYYDQHIKSDGSIIHYIYGEVDSVITAAGMIDLINSGKLTPQQKEEYQKAVNFVYHEMEKQTTYPEAGNMWQHSERDGVPTKGWVRWNFCGDSFYMTQIFMSRLAQLIDKGMIEITDMNGTAVSSRDLWDGIYNRISFACENMMSETGVLYHGYCVAEKITNGVCWGRGNGWFAMALLEAALNMPDERKEILQQYFQQLMDGVLKWQDDETFLWYNVIDHREEVTDNIPESSVSSMLSYCLLKGYRKGILKDEKYHLAGIRGFNAMVADRIVDGTLVDTLASSGCTSSINSYAVSGYVDNEAKSIGALLLAIRYYK